MSNENENNAVEDLQVHKMSDDLIAIIRELVQLALLTGTNIVDHLRQVVIEEDEETGKLIPTEEYIHEYNKMVEQLMIKAQEQQEQMENEQTAEGKFTDGGLELPNLMNDTDDNSGQGGMLN